MLIQTKSAARSIGRLSNKIRRRIDGFSSKGSFSGAQGRVLHYILAQTDDVFQKDIEEEYGMRPSTATELLKKMEQNGLISREPASYDARLKKITASEKAMRYREQVVSDLSGMENELIKGITEKELETFFQVVDKMIYNLS